MLGALFMVLFGGSWFAPLGASGHVATPETPHPVEDFSALSQTSVVAREPIVAAEVAAAGSPLAGTEGYSNKPGMMMLGVPGRKQFDQGGGYCGEVTIQMLMMKHGAWIPQSVARAAGGGELLLGVNYDKALNALGISYAPFKGSGAQAFFAFAKEQLLKDRGVVLVAYLRGSNDADYDHIMPVVGVKYARPTGYDGNDVFYVNNDYKAVAVQRKANGYACTKGNKQSLDQAGCVPTNTRYGVALAGPRYLGIGPRTELVKAQRFDEPCLGCSRTLGATLVVRDLTAGAKYAVYAPTKAPPKGAKPSGTPFKSFTATGPTWSTPVTLASDKATWYVCVQTGGPVAPAPCPTGQRRGADGKCVPPAAKPPAAKPPAAKPPTAKPGGLTASEVRKHNKPGSDCWVVVKGGVYDVSRFAHPGGANRIKCGTDISRGFPHSASVLKRKNVESKGAFVRG